MVVNVARNHAPLALFLVAVLELYSCLASAIFSRGQGLTNPRNGRITWERRGKEVTQIYVCTQVMEPSVRETRWKTKRKIKNRSRAGDKLSRLCCKRVITQTLCKHVGIFQKQTSHWRSGTKAKRRSVKRQRRDDQHRRRYFFFV